MAQASQDLISIRELRELAGRFFDVLESHGFSDIKVARSEYFTTFSIEAFDMDGQAVVAGDVWDDLEDVRKELPQHRDGDS
ncbi:hypothetical protein CLF39_26180, partial [Salmonella enterica subsp. enterica serovar Kottbus]|nr:hypothetical protein [Salmonella enterica subsp. enterica serovar Kottbus]